MGIKTKDALSVEAHECRVVLDLGKFLAHGAPGSARDILEDDNLGAVFGHVVYHAEEGATALATGLDGLFDDVEGRVCSSRNCLR